MAIITLNNNSLSSVTALPAGVGGKVLQVVSTTKVDVFSSTSTSYTDITGLSASVTPSNSSNKILVFCNASTSVSGDNNAHLQLLRESTVIANGTDGTIGAFAAINGNSTGFRYSTAQQSISFLDTPSTTSAITYKIQIKSDDVGITTYINRRGLNTYLSGSSSITLMEVSA